MMGIACLSQISSHQFSKAHNQVLILLAITLDPNLLSWGIETYCSGTCLALKKCLSLSFKIHINFLTGEPSFSLIHLFIYLPNETHYSSITLLSHLCFAHTHCSLWWNHAYYMCCSSQPFEFSSFALASRCSPSGFTFGIPLQVQLSVSEFQWNWSVSVASCILQPLFPIIIISLLCLPFQVIQYSNRMWLEYQLLV